MTKLLISVRSTAEARIACEAGADLIDVKEPSRGSLGAADPATIAQIAREVAGRRPLSVALGELVEGVALPDSLAAGAQYAKYGLAGCGKLPDWTERWKAAIARLPAGVTPVAVAYADWQVARAPDPPRVLAHAKRLGCGAVLLDTFDKSGGSVVDQMGWPALRAFVSAAADQGLASALAGSLRVEHVEDVARLSPDYVAVRGAACAGDRTGQLDGACVRRLATLVRRATERNSSEARRRAEVSAEQALARFTTGLID